MMAWEIKHIFDGDYGCEELQPGENIVAQLSRQKSKIFIMN